MTMPDGAPTRGTVTDLVNGLLDRGYNSAVQPVLDSVGRATNSGIVQTRLNQLEAEAQRLDEAGERMRPSNPVLRAVLADLEDVLTVQARRIDGASEGVQETGINAAGRVQRQLALPGMTDQQMARIGLGWNTPDPEAVAQLVNYSGSDAWREMVRSYAGEVVDTVRNQAIRGISGGWSPLRTAREVRRVSENLPAYQANNLMRTLQLTSYRDATAIHQQANVGIVQEVIRIAALDDRTCLACIAQHGEVIWSGEGAVPRVNDHHQGRCTSVVRVRGRQLSVRTGEAWFASLPEVRQVAIAGTANASAMKAGAVQLRDFVQPYSDPVFGEMQREASLTRLLGAGAREYMRR